MARSLWILAAMLLAADGGCVGSPARDQASTAPAPLTATTRPTAAAYVTFCVDSVDGGGDGEPDVVRWLRAYGTRVEPSGSGDVRLFDGPECRRGLVQIRRVLRTRLDVISQNMANVDTTRDGSGGLNPYRRKVVLWEPGKPVRIVTDPTPFRQKHSPGDRDADAKGYVSYPNVDIEIEQMNALEVTKMYRAVLRTLVRFDPTYVGIEADGGDPERGEPIQVKPGPF